MNLNVIKSCERSENWIKKEGAPHYESTTTSQRVDTSTVFVSLSTLFLWENSWGAPPTLEWRKTMNLHDIKSYERSENWIKKEVPPRTERTPESSLDIYYMSMSIIQPCALLSTLFFGCSEWLLAKGEVQ